MCFWKENFPGILNQQGGCESIPTILLVGVFKTLLGVIIDQPVIELRPERPQINVILDHTYSRRSEHTSRGYVSVPRSANVLTGVSIMESVSVPRTSANCFTVSNSSIRTSSGIFPSPQKNEPLFFIYVCVFFRPRYSHPWNAPNRQKRTPA